MKSFAFIFSFLASVTSNASPEAPTPKEFQALMKLGYKAFDQALPGGGWRAIEDNYEAGKVLDSYQLHNLGRLEAWQTRVIYWHAGQVYALADLNDLGVARFQMSYDPDEKPDDTVKWNAYVRGSIAFLKHDRGALQSARDEMYAADSSENNLNRKVLEGLLRCFDKPYREAYSASCRP